MIALSVGLLLGVAGVSVGFVLPGPPVAISIDPGAVTLAPMATQRFSVTFRDARGRTVSARPSWLVTGGLSDGEGLYTAGTTAGDYKVAASLGNLTARASVTVVPGPATVLEVSPAAINLAPLAKQQVTAVARDQWGNTLAPSELKWTIRPEAVGSLTSLGVFAAAASRASGEVTVAAGALQKTIPVTVCPPLEGVGTMTFNITCSASAYSYIETTTSSSDAKSFVASIDDDVAHVQADFGKIFVDKPVVYVFTNARSFTTGLQIVFGRSTAAATKAGADLSAVFMIDKNAIAIDYAEAKQQGVSVTLRHELTHMLIHQIVGQLGEARLPIWVNEGTAVSEETTAAPEWERAVHKYFAGSLAATQTLPSLNELTSLVIWNSKSGDDLEIEYTAAYAAVQLLREDLTPSGAIKIFDLIALNRTFEQAYREVSGKDFEVFAESFARRVKDSATPYPAIATAADTPSGAGVSLILYGFAPSSTVRVTVTGNGYNYSTSVATTSYGTYFTWLGQNWPAGSYTVTASGTAGNAKVQVVK